MHMIQDACNLRYKRMPIHHFTYAMPNARNAQRKAIHMLQSSSHRPTQEFKHTPSSPHKRVKVAWSSVWWKYRLVGHVWVHGSKLSSLMCSPLMIYVDPSENDTSPLMCLILEWSTGFFATLMVLCYHIEVWHGYTPHRCHSWCMWSKGAESNN
jgi:hypothetical protein